MRKPNIPIFLIAFLVFLVSIASAQETEERVVDEVVAVVNDGVITLSKVKREMKSIVDLDVQQGKSREQAERDVQAKQGELIANLINEELIMQKAKELNLDPDIEASINQRMLEIMKEYNLKSLDALYEQMRSQNLDPQEIRDMWKKQAARERILQSQVQAKLYWSFSPKELKDYFDKNKAKFTKPEKISFSEIFLSFAGRQESAVRENANKIVAQLKSGANFSQIQKEQSDPGMVTQGAGKLEKVRTDDLPEIIKTPLKNVKVGSVTDPIEIKDLGIIILKVDEREAASSESEFNESAVRLAMMQEKYPQAAKDYFAKLREDAYIKINDNYRPLVAPILYADERQNKQAAKNDKEN
jgi:hypothetical protein